MPRGPRLDAPGMPHITGAAGHRHVIGRGIERKEIFRGVVQADEGGVREGMPGGGQGGADCAATS